MKTQIEELKEKHRKDIQKLNDGYEEKLRNLSINDIADISIHSEELFAKDKNMARIIELQVEENKSLRKAVEELLSNNHQQKLAFCEEKESELEKANELIEKMTEKYNKVEKKLKETKIYHRLFRHSQSIQWKYCNKFYPSNTFVSHSQTCAIGETGESDKLDLSSVEISITQTLIREDENLRKPFTIYVIELNLDGETWVVQRKYKEFWNLNETLTNYFPNVKFPSAAAQFSNKSLGDIVKKKKTAAVEDRRKILQRYLNGLAQIPSIRDSDFFKDFICIKWVKIYFLTILCLALFQQNQFLKRSALPQCLLGE